MIFNVTNAVVQGGGSSDFFGCRVVAFDDFTSEEFEQGYAERTIDAAYVLGAFAIGAAYDDQLYPEIIMRVWAGPNQELNMLGYTPDPTTTFMIPMFWYDGEAVMININGDTDPNNDPHCGINFPAGVAETGFFKVAIIVTDEWPFA